MMVSTDPRPYPIAPGALGAQINAPRELTVSERVEGLQGGLNGLRAELAVLLSKLVGGMGGETSDAKLPAPGLLAAVDRAEADLRTCHDLVSELQRRL